MSSLKLLMLEDSQLDAELILREIKGMDQKFEVKVLSQKSEFEQAVRKWNPDLIISDFNLQTFNGDEALAFAKKIRPETAFIMLSGSITKKMEVTLLDNRANDVLTKDSLKRLPFAINRVLNERKDKYKLNKTLVELAENLKYQEALADISIQFNTSDNFDLKINHSLKILGELAGVSRVYIFEDFDKGRRTKNTFEWCNKDVNPQKYELQDISYEQDIPSWKPYLLDKGRIYFTDVDQSPKDMQAILKPQDIKAIIAYPIKLGNDYSGFIGFDEVRNPREWTDSEDKFLKSISGLISNAYGEELAKKKLRDSNKRLTELLKEKDALVGEVHHRVKNNLALISSFLQLEQMGISNYSSSDELLSANILRIKSIAIVHEIVYQQGSFSKISVVNILEKILSEIFLEKSETNVKIIKLGTESEVVFNINQAVPFSLLISEIMFQVFGIQGNEKYIPLAEIIISAEKNDEFVFVNLEERALLKILSVLKKGEKYKFSEIIEVLGRQLEAELIIDKSNDKATIKFKAKNMKGASSTLI